MDGGSLEGMEVLTLRMGRADAVSVNFVSSDQTGRSHRSRALRLQPTFPRSLILIRGQFRRKRGDSIRRDDQCIYIRYNSNALNTYRINPDNFRGLDFQSGDGPTRMDQVEESSHTPVGDATNRAATTSPVNRSCGIGCGRRSGERRGKIQLTDTLIGVDRLQSSLPDISGRNLCALRISYGEEEPVPTESGTPPWCDRARATRTGTGAVSREN